MWENKDYLNLYQNIYDSLEETVQEKTFTTLSKQTKFSPTDLKDIILHNNFPKDMNQNCINLLFESEINTTTILTFEQLQKCHAKIINAYKFEQELSNLEIELEHAIYPIEIWINEDLSDSSFDILIDLQIIDIIFFGQENKTNSSAKFGKIAPQTKPTMIADYKNNTHPNLLALRRNISRDRSSISSQIAQTTQNIFTPITNSLPVCSDPDTLNLKPFTPPIRDANLDKKIEQEKQLKNITNESYLGGNFTSLSVFNEDDLNNQANINNNNKTTDNNNSNNNHQTSNNKTDNNNLNLNNLSIYSDLFKPDNKSFCPISEDQGSEESGMSDSFSACVEIEFNINGGRMNIGGSKDSENCIQCNLIYINDKLGKLLNYNIVPEKNTKHSWETSNQYNLKPSLGFSGLNFIVITKPSIKTPIDPFINKEDTDTMEKIATKNKKKEEEEWSIIIEHQKLMGELAKATGQYGEFNKLSYNANSDEKTLTKIPDSSNFTNVTETLAQNQLEIDKNINNTLNSYYNGIKANNFQLYGMSFNEEISKFNSYLAAFQEQFTYMGSIEEYGLSGRIRENYSRECTTM